VLSVEATNTRTHDLPHSMWTR